MIFESMTVLVKLPFEKQLAGDLSAENSLHSLCDFSVLPMNFKGKFIFFILFSEIGHSDF